MSAASTRFDRHSRAAFITACLTLLISGVAFRGVVQALNVYLQKEPVELRASLSLIPTTLGPWKAVGEDRLFEAATIESLGTDKYLDRSYALEGGTREDVLKVHLAYYTGMIDTVPHVPDRCWDAAGLNVKTLPNNLSLPIDPSAWAPDPSGVISLATNTVYTVAWVRDHAGRVVNVHLPTGDFILRTLEFEDEKSQGWRIFGGYFFIANNRMTPAPEGVKMLAFDPREKFAYYCKVQYTFVTQDAGKERFLSLAADHLQHLLPQLMRCLPDWAEVERRGKPNPTTLETQNAPPTAKRVEDHQPRHRVPSLAVTHTPARSIHTPHPTVPALVKSAVSASGHRGTQMIADQDGRLISDSRFFAFLCGFTSILGHCCESITLPTGFNSIGPAIVLSLQFHRVLT